METAKFIYQDNGKEHGNYYILIGCMWGIRSGNRVPA